MLICSSTAARRNACLERRHDHRRAAELDRRDQLGVATGGVKKRNRHQVSHVHAGRESRHPQAGLAVGQEVLVGGHRTLGEAGGAAGVEDRCERLVIRVGGDVRLAVGEQHHRRTRVGDDVVDLALGEASVDRDDHGACHQRAPESEAPLEAVAVAVGDAIARSHACGTKAAGDAGRTVPHLPVGHPLTAEDDDALVIGVVIHRRSKHVQQRGRQRRVTQDAVVGADDAGHVERHRPRGATLLCDRAAVPVRGRRRALVGGHRGPQGRSPGRSSVTCGRTDCRPIGAAYVVD